MDPAIHFDPGGGELRVGGTLFRCAAAPSGGLVVEGRSVTPISLGDRDRLVALCGGGDDNRASSLARLVGDAATLASEPSRDDADSEVRAALEAVALHLAGAELAGALAATTLLLARSVGGFGESVATLPALEADRLAAALAASLRPPGRGVASDDDGADEAGWTTITFEAPEPTSGPAPASPSAYPATGPAAVRDRLAASLLARDRPIDAELAALLIDAVPATNRPHTTDPGVGAGPPVTVTETDRWRQAGAPADADAVATHVPAPSAAVAVAPTTDLGGAVAASITATAPGVGGRRGHDGAERAWPTPATAATAAATPSSVEQGRGRHLTSSTVRHGTTPAGGRARPHVLPPTTIAATASVGHRAWRRPDDQGLDDGWNQADRGHRPAGGAGPVDRARPGATTAGSDDQARRRSTVAGDLHHHLAAIAAALDRAADHRGIR